MNLPFISTLKVKYPKNLNNHYKLMLTGELPFSEQIVITRNDNQELKKEIERLNQDIEILTADRDDWKARYIIIQKG